MAIKKRTSTKAGKKKKWFKILAPAIFNKAEIGEMPLLDSEQAIGRCIKINLMALTRDPKKQDRQVSFLINGKKESFLTTVFKSYELLPSAVKRMVKRNRSKVDDSFTCQTKDKKELKIKPVLVTRNKINKATKSDLRKECKIIIKEEVLKLDYDHFLSMLIIDKFQKQLNEELRKIVPLAACKIRKMELILRKKE